MNAEESVALERAQRIQECHQELSAFIEEVERGQIKPSELVIVFRCDSGAFGMRAAGANAMQVFLLECAKAVVISKSINPAQPPAANDPTPHKAGHA